MGLQLLYIIVGIVGGIIVGMLGGGIGPIIVLSLIFTFSSMGLQESESFRMAVATSLAVICITTLVSMLSHCYHLSIDVLLLKRIFPGAIAGAIIGSFFSLYLPAKLLQPLFGFLMLYLAFTMLPLNSIQDCNHDRKIPSCSIMVAISTILAIISTFLGVCYGLLLLPYLKRYNFQINKIIPLIAICNFFVASIGLFPFIFPHSHTKGSFGLIYLPAFLYILLFSVVSAPIGTYLSKKVSEKVSQGTFALVSTCVGLKFIFF